MKLERTFTEQLTTKDFGNMANMCSNYVTFSGSPDDSGRYMFDLQTYDLEEGNFAFDSRQGMSDNKNQIDIFLNEVL